MVKIAFVVYRKWGYDIFKEILQYQKKRKDFLLTTLIVPEGYDFQIESKIKRSISVFVIDPKDSNKIQSILEKDAIDIACFYSWSWIIKESLLKKFICICLHPSPLPKYRGGTPIQHQLVNGEDASAVTIFKMAKGIDNGDIYMQTPISFLGTVTDIFSRMIDVGTVITKHLIEDAINNTLRFKPQKNLDKFPPLKRRTPAQSEIKLDTLNEILYSDLYNLVRGLLDPYPNAFIKLSKTIITVQEIQKYKFINDKGIILNDKSLTIDTFNKTNIYLKLKDAYAKLSEYKIERL